MTPSIDNAGAVADGGLSRLAELYVEELFEQLCDHAVEMATAQRQEYAPAVKFHESEGLELRTKIIQAVQLDCGRSPE